MTAGPAPHGARHGAPDGAPDGAREGAPDGAPHEALLAGLLADAGGDPERHLDLLGDERGDLVGPLVVRAGALEDFRERLPQGAHALRVHLVADAADARDGLATLREARNGLFDDDRVEVVGVQLALPPGVPPAAAAHALLDALDFTAPAWLDVPLTDGWEDALEVVAQDGTEHVAVDPAADTAGLAAFVRRCADLGLAFRVGGRTPDGLACTVSGGNPGDPHGVLNLLCAVRATLAGAGPAQVAAVLRSTDTVALASALQTTGPADAAAVRALLAQVDVHDVGALRTDLWHEGLLP